MTSLSERQRTDLNNAILNYLKPSVSDAVLTKLQEELHIDSVVDDNNILPKKWNAIIRLQKKILDLESQIEQLSQRSNISPFLDTAADGSDSALVKLNWVPSKTKKTLNNSSSVTSLAIHPKLSQLINGNVDGSFTIWNLLDPSQPQAIVQAHSKSLNHLAISPTKLEFNDNNHVLVTCGSDLFVKVWDLQSLKLIRTLNGHEHIVSNVIFKDSLHIFTCSRDKTIKLWDLKTGWCLRSFVGHSDWVRTLDLAASEYLLSGSNDQSIRLSHGDSGTGLGLMIGHNQVVEVVKFIPRISNQYVDNLNLLDIPDNEGYEEIGFKYAVSGGRDDLIHIWLLPLPIVRPHNHPLPPSNPQGQLVKTLKGHKSWVKDLAIHPNGRILISCSDDKLIKFWDLKTGECLRTLAGHEGFVNRVAFASPIFENSDDYQTQDGKVINDSMRCIFASGATDSLVRIWE